MVLSQYDDPGTRSALLATAAARPRLPAQGAGRPWTSWSTRCAVAAGGSVVDPRSSRRSSRPAAAAIHVGRLSAREREVLAEMARGQEQRRDPRRAVLTERAVEKHINSIFAKLGLAGRPTPPAGAWRFCSSSRSGRPAPPPHRGSHPPGMWWLRRRPRPGRIGTVLGMTPTEIGVEFLDRVTDHYLDGLCALVTDDWTMHGGPPGLPPGRAGVHELFRHIGRCVRPGRSTWSGGRPSRRPRHQQLRAGELLRRVRPRYPAGVRGDLHPPRRRQAGRRDLALRRRPGAVAPARSPDRCAVKTLHRILAGTAVLGLGVATAVARPPPPCPARGCPSRPRRGRSPTVRPGPSRRPRPGTARCCSTPTARCSRARRTRPSTAPDRFTGNVLLERGYALAGTSYAGTGWAVEEALDDQIAVLETLPVRPREVLAWGSSLGGLVTAELVEQHPDRIAGALPMCGVLAGGVRLWDTFQDMQSALTTLLGPGAVLRVAGPAAAAARLRYLLDAAQETPEGRARIALVAALGGLPGWAGAGTPRPTGPAGREAADYATLRDQLVELMVFGRAELRQRAGGNPSSTSGAARFRDAARRDDVARLYAEPGSISPPTWPGSTPPRRSRRIRRPARTWPGSARPRARCTGVPVLTLHTTGDGVAVPEHESAYATPSRRGRRGAARPGVRRTGGSLPVQHGRAGGRGRRAGRARPHRGRSGPVDPAVLAARARALGPERTCTSTRTARCRSSRASSPSPRARSPG